MNKDTPDTDPIGDLLDTVLMDMPAIDTSDEAPELIEIVELAPDQIDPRLKLLSHSSRTTLHKCPRKYQLYRLSSEQIALEETKGIEQGVTFAYGSAVGVGIQSVMEGKSEVQVTIDTFLEWDVDLLDETPRQKKSFWLALFAVQKFMGLREKGFLDEYELVYYNDKPAVELSFNISLPNGFYYRGFLDAVLQHKQSKEVLVLENKTSSGTANSAMFKNSGQALGYSVILDILFPNLSSYSVLYLVYETRSMEYKELPYEKSLLQRALWLQELLIDTQLIETYEAYNTYPMHGESCFDFFRECEYLSLCTLSTDALTKPLTTAILGRVEEDKTKYDFSVDFYDLVTAQIEKGDV